MDGHTRSAARIEIDAVRAPGGIYLVANASGNPPERLWRHQVAEICDIFRVPGLAGFLLTDHQGHGVFRVSSLPGEDRPANTSPGGLQACVAVIHRLYGMRQVTFITAGGPSTATMRGREVQLTLEGVPGVRVMAHEERTGAAGFAAERSYVICRRAHGPPAMAEIPPQLSSVAPVSRRARVLATLNAAAQRLRTRSDGPFVDPSSASGEAVAAVVACCQFGMLRPGPVEVVDGGRVRQSVLVGEDGPPFTHVRIDAGVRHLFMAAVDLTEPRFTDQPRRSWSQADTSSGRRDRDLTVGRQPGRA